MHKQNMQYQIVLTPQNVKILLEDSIATKVETFLQQCAEMHKIDLFHVCVEHNHVRFIAAIDPSISVDSAINRLKNESYQKLQSEVPALKELSSGNSFWSDGYFVETVGTLSMNSPFCGKDCLNDNVKF